MKNNFNYSDVFVLIALLLGGFALYFIPLQSTSFYFDDRVAITNNETIRHLDVPKIYETFNTRSLVGLSFALNYKWGGLNPFSYRLINLIIHCLNAFLVYLLAKSTLRFFAVLRMKINLEWPAFFASMLFLCHPIQTEAVNPITQRFVLMGTFFYLSTLLLYIQYRCRSQKSYLIASMATAMAAMFCKEFTVTLPLMLVAYELYFLNRHSDPERSEGEESKGFLRYFASLRMTIPFFIIVLIVPILLFKTPREAIGVANIADNRALSPIVDITRARGSISRKEYFLTELNVMRTYVRLLFLPVNQNFDYDYPLSHQLDAKTLLSGIFLLCLLALAAVTYWSFRIISFSILWFFITLSVESSFIPIGHVIAEYRLYLASVGFVFLVTFLVYSRQMELKRLNLIAVIILIGFSVLTYQRNAVWKNEFTLWDDTVRKSPQKPRAYNNRGLEYYRQGNFTGAITDFTKAIQLKPDYAAAYNNRGVLYALTGDSIDAMSDFNKAIKINPQYTDAYNNRHRLKQN